MESLLFIEDGHFKWPNDGIEVSKHIASTGFSNPLDGVAVSLQSTSIVQPFLHLLKGLALVYLCPATDRALVAFYFGVVLRAARTVEDGGDAPSQEPQGHDGYHIACGHPEGISVVGAYGQGHPPLPEQVEQQGSHVTQSNLANTAKGENP